MVVMGEEYHARCDYCGATKSHHWIKRQYGLYCSYDCLFAKFMWSFACMSFLMVLMGLFFWTILGMYAFPGAFVFLLFALIFLFLTSRGKQARKRVKRWSIN